MFSRIVLLGALAGTTMAGTVLWDGRFNNMTASTELYNCSFSNEVGQYQYYIHGTGPVTDYVNLSPDYKNPADTSSNKGAKMTIDNSSVWNNDGMLRTELISQTSAAINKGKVYYHFSMQHTGVNPPGPHEEHQVCFFESHFTEMKYGLISGEQGTSDNTLRWDVSSDSKWNTTYTEGVWHNIAYEIDFDGQTVAFYHSTGADDLALTAGPFPASTSSNGADWHLGVLRLPASSDVTADTAPEDWYFSGVYIESAPLTSTVSGPGGVAPAAAGGSSSAASTTPAASPVAIASLSSYSSVSQPATTLQTSVASISSSSSILDISSSSSAPISSSSVASSSSSTTSTSVAVSSSSKSIMHVQSTVTVSPISATSSAPPSTVSSKAAPSLTSFSAYIQSSATMVQATSANSAAAASASTNSEGECIVNYLYV